MSAVTPAAQAPSPEPPPTPAALAAAASAATRPTRSSGYAERPVGWERWESRVVGLLVTLAFAALGLWVVTDLHVLGADALDRFARALMVWHNDPPKLAAIGLDDPPLGAMAATPLAIWAGGVSSLVVVPVASAVFAGLAAASLVTLMRRCGLTAPVRYAVLVGLLANPVTAWYAVNGQGTTLTVALLVLALSSAITWFATADPRHLMLGGLAFCLWIGSDYGAIAWFLLTVVLIAGVLGRAGVGREQIEGSVVGFSAPMVYVVALWSILNLLFVRNPVAWLVPDRVAASEVRGAELARGLLELVLTVSPVTLVVLPLLLWRGLGRGDVVARWLAGAIVLALGEPALSAWFGWSASPLSLGDGLVLLAITVIGGVWLARAMASAAVGGALLATALLATVPWSFHAVGDYRYQALEGSFARAVRTGESQEGSRTPTGQTVGFDPELAMAGYIDDNVASRGSILTDNAATYGVLTLSGRPELFFDRVDQGDAVWRAAVAAPPERVRYVLVATDGRPDLVAEAYPAAAAGGDADLPVVFRTDRYVLLSVPAGFVQRPQQQLDGTAADPSVPAIPSTGGTP
ncbi:hypothetical protein K8Z61_15105 [Nocardioides sp. TRM66260-LWL]|uniref:hypothetical protein n=1 Tax=Nocardioides sp. TRM66260-LWL TaxID=2874478 RepID=UPI001CC36026|nr:hypothetical protein [Nocardioides sp. TRM66260-LWL]MBZ5735821.1 hypothetical protein [Nocardioides sp. TRM66260-LWL]